MSASDNNEHLRMLRAANGMLTASVGGSRAAYRVQEGPQGVRYIIAACGVAPDGVTVQSECVVSPWRQTRLAAAVAICHLIADEISA